MSQIVNLATGGGGGGTVSASGSSISLGEVVFSNSNNVSFGLNGSTITASASGLGGSLSAGSSSISLGQVVFSNSNNVSFGLSGSTITGSIPAQVYISKFPPESPAGTAAALVASQAYHYSGSTAITVGGSATGLSIYIVPHPIPYNLSFNRVWRLNAAVHTGGTAGTWSQTMNQMAGLYTDNAGTLQLLSTWNIGGVISQNSSTAITIQWWWGTNSTANSSGLTGNVFSLVAITNGANAKNMILSDGAHSLSAGNYWLAMVESNLSAGVATTTVAVWNYPIVTKPNALVYAAIGASTSSALDRYLGIVATTLTSNAASITNLLPVTINSTDINTTGFNAFLLSVAGLFFAST